MTKSFLLLAALCTLTAFAQIWLYFELRARYEAAAHKRAVGQKEHINSTSD
ncbi:MAG TPA: hypothetical protein VFZ34_31570 [Blastocatellia bacterium]|nr:hypothetical protein [Blastocatellia bacterium]